MRFSVETWAPEYGVAADEQALDERDVPVDPAVERAASDWSPIAPTSPAADHVVFVDGVRRIDARIWIDDGRGRSWSAVCASVGAGAVVADVHGARVTGHGIRRVLVAAAEAAAEPITTRHGRYDVVESASDESAAVYLAIHEAMTELEQSVDVGATPPGGLVIYDGPLRGRRDDIGVGYVKTQRVQYLEPSLAPVVGALGPGERTPVFRVGHGRGWFRDSTYLRLPGPRPHPWAGIVRIEVAGTRRPVDSIERLDAVAATLPRFASDAHKEPRAPQNLYPIAGLEHRLRHLLGDPLVLERSLRIAAHP